MTDPTITRGHKYMSDLTNLTEVWEGTSETWTETRQNMLAAHAVETVVGGDILQIQAQFNDGATDEYCYYSYPNEGGANNLGFASNDYPVFYIHYKTSGSATSPGAQAKAELVFNDATTQEVLAACYSTEWAVAATEITSSKTIDHIRLYADDVGTDGTFYVYYDFVMICANQFSIPYVNKVQRVEMPDKKAIIEIPGRRGDIIQNLGMNSPRIRLEGTMEYAAGHGWGTPYGAELYRILRGSEGGYHDPWQWLATDEISCKVTPAPGGFMIGEEKGMDAQRVWSMDFLMYSLSSLDLSQWDNLEWAGQ